MSHPTYWIARNGEGTGPYTIEQIKELINSGQVTLQDQANKVDSQDGWVPLQSILNSPPTTAQPQAVASPPNLSNSVQAAQPQQQAHAGLAGTNNTGFSQAPKQPSFLKKWALKLGGFVVVIAIVLGMKMCNAKGDSNEAKELFKKQFITLVNDYSNNQEYYDNLIDEYHPAAFDSAYTQRKRSTDFDGSIYTRTILASMQREARRDGKKELDLLNLEAR